ncbi:hypothetical protein E4T66_18555 [Sinimarinibacterium sp. CAU 1509]|uniref:hypothetical protein n=1 Tax=Sinimarinibacterium sp. CAU 1509 TaxID=2562283 RepID=UPI0010AD255E|nr:hypothetical protein [Sinimarinibacterium sp. CAU 1509]TJY57409.1 hypothetical protein E4T66_18555 [Sinimarinibacterium sp. CAU 1509]
MTPQNLVTFYLLALTAVAIKRLAYEDRETSVVPEILAVLLKYGILAGLLLWGGFYDAKH